MSQAPGGSMLVRIRRWVRVLDMTLPRRLVGYNHFDYLATSLDGDDVREHSPVEEEVFATIWGSEW